jgi:hypothetical protein
MIRDLLFRDIDGAYSTEPEIVIDGAAAEPRYLERVPGLRAVLTDDRAPRYHRYLAVVALASWGHEPVYPVVAATAEAGRTSPWYGMLVDRDGRDRTFPELAGAVAEGKRFAGSSADRLAALRALLGRADQLFFDWQLAYAADEPQLAQDVAVAIEQGLDRAFPDRASSGRAEGPDFDRVLQLADLCAVLARHDRPRAVDLAERLLRRDSRLIVRTHLCSVVPFRA